jgi:hypothetical protein
MLGVRPIVSVNSLLGCPPLHDHLTHAACRPASVKEKKRTLLVVMQRAVLHFFESGEKWAQCPIEKKKKRKWECC